MLLSKETQENSIFYNPIQSISRAIYPTIEGWYDSLKKRGLIFKLISTLFTELSLSNTPYIFIKTISTLSLLIHFDLIFIRFFESVLAKP